MDTMIFGAPVINYLIALVLAALGYGTHVLMKVGALRDSDASVTLSWYFNRYPYNTIAKLMIVLLAVLGLVEPNITPIALVGYAGLGYGADSAGNYLKAK